MHKIGASIIIAAAIFFRNVETLPDTVQTVPQMIGDLNFRRNCSEVDFAHQEKRFSGFRKRFERTVSRCGNILFKSIPPADTDFIFKKIPYPVKYPAFSAGNHDMILKRFDEPRFVFHLCGINAVFPCKIGVADVKDCLFAVDFQRFCTLFQISL